MSSVRLGMTDVGSAPVDLEAYFDKIHEASMQDLFREEKNEDWREPTKVPGTSVRSLQEKLAACGFLPRAHVPGVFGYRTQSAVRLFQEVVRTQEGHTEVDPDGVAGPITQGHLDRWVREERKADWSSGDRLDPWYRLLKALRDRVAANPGPIQAVVRDRWQQARRPDTPPVSEWNTSKDVVHLIGIRRGATEAQKIRLNNDLFVLLAGGGVFTFFGSTDPNPEHARSDMPFLIPGQHLYRFGWHKVSDSKKTYRAFRPRSAGVLVIRANRRTKARGLNEQTLANAVDPTPNDTINIHWSGKHTSSWSAGCQVISGGGYIDHRDELIDCWRHAAFGYGGLAKQTRGAYCVLLDLITSLTTNPSVVGGDLLHYTLINQRDLDLEPSLGADYLTRTLRRGLGILKEHARDKFDLYASQLE